MLMPEFNGKKPVKKPITADELNDLLFEMIGLSLTADGVVLDDDLNSIIAIKGKYMVRDQELLNEAVPCLMLYDPAHNPSIMDKLFKHYLAKYNAQHGVETNSIASINSSLPGKSYLELVQTDGVVYKSGSYYNDNMKCADIIFQLNCDMPIYNLHSLDKELYDEIQKQIEERKHGKRGGRKKKQPEPVKEPIEYKSVTEWLDEANKNKNE